MTTNTIEQLVAPTALTATLTTTLYGAVAASTKVIVKEIILCNTDTSSRTVTLYYGTGTAAANTILSGLILAAKETKIITLSSVLITGDFIKGGADAGSVVSCTISGVKVV